MNAELSKKMSIEEWIDLFSDPASSLSAFGQHSLPYKPLGDSAFLALWLELFLYTGEKVFKERWDSLSSDEQVKLGIEILQCFLFQPLYLRLSPEGDKPVIHPPLKLKSQGRFFIVEHGHGKNFQTDFLYPLNHHHFWPSIINLIPRDFFSSKQIQNSLEPGIIIASSSRFKKIRLRAETLKNIFQGEGPPGPLTDQPQEEPLKSQPLQEETSDIRLQETEVREPAAPEQPASVPSTSPPSPPQPPKRKKKKKASMAQMDLF